MISLDSEHEMEDECRALGGCFLDYLSGQYRINLLEPRCWDDGSGPDDPDAPEAFRGTLLCPAHLLPAGRVPRLQGLRHAPHRHAGADGGAII